MRSAGQRLRRTGQRWHPSPGAGNGRIENIIVIGASAGGLGAISAILRGLPPDVPAAVVIVLHQNDRNDFDLVTALERSTKIPVVMVEEDEPLRQGVIYVPQPGMSLSFKGRKICAAPIDEPFIPIATIDRMFASAARKYGARVIGVVLSGLMRDGTQGLASVHGKGGLTVVQDPAGAEYPEMPTNAMRGLPVTFCLALPDIAATLDLLARRTGQLERGAAVSVRILTSRVDLLIRLKAQSGKNKGTCDFLEGELLSLKRDIGSIARLLRAVRPKSSKPARNRVRASE